MKKTTIISIIVAIATLAGLVLTWNITAYRDVDMLKVKTPLFLQERGFKITSYDGYEGSLIHGGITWYQVRDSSNYLYVLAIAEWRGELMIYNQTCLNAVRNDKKD